MTKEELKEYERKERELDELYKKLEKITLERKLLQREIYELEKYLFEEIYGIKF